MSNNYNGSSRKILIIGSGAAGYSAAKAARAQDPDAGITIITRESRLPYYRLRLCDYIGKDADYNKLEISREEWFQDNRIRVGLSSEVTAIDTAAKKITASGKEYTYDSLVLATGSTPIMPPFKGKELTGVHTIWTWEDITGINNSLREAKKAAVIGGGLLGLEAAHKISDMGIGVTLLEAMPRLLPKQLDEEGSEIFKEKVQSLGITVICGKPVEGFEGDESGHVRQVRLADGTSLDADIVAVTVGVAPNTSVFRDSGIDMNRFVTVNDKMETSLKDVYAAGDVVSVNGRWFGLWSVASSQGQVAGTNAAGGDAVYKANDAPYMLASMGTRVVCSGDTCISRPDTAKEAYEILQNVDKDHFSYSRLIFHDGVFVGYILIGEPAKAFNKLQSLIKTSASSETINNILYP